MSENDIPEIEVDEILEEEIEEAVPAELPEDATFRDITNDSEILRSIDELGFTKPTEVQRKAIPTALQGHDMLVQAQTGSGKTLAFILPMVAALKSSGRDQDLHSTFALVVVPTRELALQGVEVLNSLKTGIRPTCVIGGSDLNQQLRELKEDARVVIGTPGRLLDLIKQRALRLNNCRFFALDEVDEMLSIGFIEDVRSILSRLPDRRQGMFVSATITPRVEMLANSFLNFPKNIFVQKVGSAPAPIEHLYCEIGGDLMAKPAALCDFIETLRPRSAIIFCNTKSDTQLVEALLRRRGFDARRLNSDLTQAQRNRVMSKIRKGELQFLVATDIAARGLDIEQIDLVVNYAIHEQPEAYVHRTGRTGRAGRSGKAISLIGPRDFGAFHFLTKVLELKFTKIPVPTDTEVADARVTHLYEMIRQKEIEIRERDVFVARQVLREMGGFAEAPEELEEIIAKLCRYTMEHFVSSEAKSLEEELDTPARPSSMDEGRGGRDDKRRGARRDRNDRGEREQRSERGERGERDERRTRGERQNREERPERREEAAPGNREERSEHSNGYEERPRSERPRSNGSDVRVYFGQGQTHGMTPGVFSDIAKEFAEVPAGDLKNISVREFYGFVDIAESKAEALISSLNGIEYNGQPLPVELAYVPSPNPRDRGRHGGGRRDNDDRRSGGGRDRRPSRDRDDRRSGRGRDSRGRR